MKSSTKSTRGGRRPGAGRKPTGRIPVLVSILPATRARWRRQAKAAGLTLPAYLDQL